MASQELGDYNNGIVKNHVIPRDGEESAVNIARDSSLDPWLCSGGALIETNLSEHPLAAWVHGEKIWQELY